MGYADIVLEDSPAAYWRLDESSGTTAADASGNNHAGTYTANGVTYGETGLVDSANSTSIKITGNGHVNIPYASWMNFTGDWTMEAWIKPTSIGGIYQEIMGRDGDGRWHQWRINLDGTISFIGFYADGGNLYVATTTAAVSANNIYHMVATYKASTTTLVLYVNGEAWLTKTDATALAGSGTTPLRLGSDSWNTAYLNNGWIDECAFYTSTLTAARVQMHYAQRLTMASQTITRDGNRQGLAWVRGGGASWVNPYTAGLLSITTSSDVWGPSTRPNIVDRDSGNWASNNVQDSWVKFDLEGTNTIALNSLSFRQRTDAGSELTQSLIVAGSNDDSSWTTIATLSPTVSQGTWTDFDFTESAAYRYIRVSQNGMSNTNNYHFILCEIELYGVYDDGQAPAPTYEHVTGATGTLDLDTGTINGLLSGSITATGPDTDLPLDTGNIGAALGAIASTIGTELGLDVVGGTARYFNVATVWNRDRHSAPTLEIISATDADVDVPIALPPGGLIDPTTGEILLGPVEGWTPEL